MRLYKNHKASTILITILLAFCFALCAKPTFAARYPVFKKMPDTAEWHASDMGQNTDIIIDKTKIGFTAYKNTSNGHTYNPYVTITLPTNNNFEVKPMVDGYLVNRGTLNDETKNNCASIRWKGPNGKGVSSSVDRHKVSGTIKLRFNQAAISITERQTYDIIMEVSNMEFKVTRDQKDGVPTLTSCYNPEKNISWILLSAFNYTHWDATQNAIVAVYGGYVGAKYRVDIKLVKTGTNTTIGSDKKMAWFFGDIDIRDVFDSTTDPHQYYAYIDESNATHEWAEHASLINDKYSLDPTNSNYTKNTFYDVYISKNSKLGVVDNNDGNLILYHKFKTSENDNDNQNYTDAIARVNPAHFSFAWRGSGCGTNINGVPGTMYAGRSFIYKGNEVNKNNKITDYSDSTNFPNSRTITVNANSQDITFRHSIERNEQGPEADQESYYVKAGGENSGSGVGTLSAPKTYDAKKREVQVAHTETITTNLKPGESKVLYQTLYYQISSVNDAMINYVSLNCSLNEVGNSDKGGTACVKLSRPVAKFKGNVDGKIIADGGNAYLTPNPDTAGTEITEENGNFKIRFTSDITRNTSSGSDADQAGGTAKTSWNIIRTVDNTQDSSTRKPASGSTSTAELNNGQTTEVVTEADNYIYSGQLKSGEIREICAILSYDSIVSINGNTSASTKKCIKVWRQNKKCVVNGTDYEYGISKGRNFGSVGVINHSLSSSYSYTASKPEDFTNYKSEVSIWARPGDSVRFVQEACAGGAYAVNNNSNLNNTTYKSVYVSTGYQSSNNSSRYLFGDTLPDKEKDTADQLLYKNSKTWDSSTATEGHFMSGKSDDDNRFKYYSPSNETSSSSYNEYTYSCSNDSSQKWYYRVRGQASSNDCHNRTETFFNDVGRSIIQTLTWNDMQVNNNSASRTYSKDNKYTATAKVVIPYNYNLQPAIYTNTTKKVIYLGDKATFDVDIHTTPRKNSSFGTDESINTYATISKPTSVEVRYYFIKGGFSGSKQLPYPEYADKNNHRFNADGKLDGATDKIEHFSVFIDNSLSVGDKVCAYVKVTPADSHNQYMAASVTGAGSTNVALNENGTSSKQSTACYTIAKKPIMSVESSNAFAGGSEGFVTSRYTKQFSKDGTQYPFGSWSEYGVYGIVNVNGNHGFASGATFGYATKNTGITLNEARNNNDSIDIAREGTHGNNICVFSTQTFANSDCNAGSGNANIGTQGINQKSADSFSSRIHDRFGPKQSEPTKTSAKCINTAYILGTTNATDYCLGTDGKYYRGTTTKEALKIRDKIKINGKEYASLLSYINNQFDDNGINHTYVEKDAYLGAAESKLTLWASHNFNNNQEYTDEDTGITYADRNYTRVIQVTNDDHNATLIIDSDIKVGDYKNDSNTNDDPELHNTGEIVNFIIIADNVDITWRVNQIDAIIVADHINTCAYGSLNDLKTGTKAVVGSNVSSETCNEQIHFRAPVATKQIILNRTYGADNGTNSIKRAEIFEMNPYNYLWSFGQMGRYSQAVTTFSRELPARY